MASTLTLKSAAYDGRYMQLTCKQTKNAQTNTSTIAWTLSTIGGNSNYYSTGPTTVLINGVQVYHKDRTNWDTKVFPASKGSVSGTVSVSHGTDGTKTITVAMITVIYHAITNATTYSSKWELDTIDLGATILTYPELPNNTTNPTVTYTNPRGSGVDSLSIGISDSLGMNMIAPYRAINKTGTLSYTFTGDDVKSLLNATAGSKFLGIQFRIRTVIGGVEYISAMSAMFTVTENADTKPTTSMTLSVVNPASMPSALSGTYIQGKSRVKATITATGKYGAKVSSYNLSVDGAVAGGASNTSASNVITSDAITASGGEVEVIGSAHDSRTFTGTATQKITVLAYSKPLVIPLGSENAILCYRSDGNGKRVGSSTSVWIKAKRSYYSLGGKNGCTLQWRRKLSSQAWNNNDHKWADLIPKASTNTDEYNALVSGEFVLKDSYTIQIRAVDDVGESDVKEFEIPTQDVALHLGRGGKNVSIGEYCDYSEEYTFRSAWKAYFDNGINGTMTQQPVLDMLAFAEGCPQGFTPFFTTGSTTNVPPTGNYLYASGFVCKRSDSQITVVIFSYYSGDLAINTYYDTAGGWLGWRYLKTTTS